MKLFIVGSAHSVHLRKIANQLVEHGCQITIFSLEPANHSLSPQVYDRRVELVDDWDTTDGRVKKKFLLELNRRTITSRPNLVWFIYASSYGRMAPFVVAKKKVVSVWGTDILVNSYKGALKASISRGLNAADRIFATSSFLRTHTVRLSHTPISLSPFGPDNAFFEPSKANASQIKKRLSIDYDRYVLCNKWLKDIYGIDLILEMVAENASYFRDQNVGIVLCGSGLDEAKYRQFVASNCIEDLIHFTGFINQDDMIALLDGASVCLFPSRSESFGVSMLEAFARQVPVIASSAGGFKELSCGGKYGVIVDLFEPDAYFSELQYALEKGTSYDLTEAKDHASSFNWSACVDQMLKQFQLICGLGPSSSEGRQNLNNGARPRLLYMHSESAFSEKNNTRARSIRVTQIREALSKTWDVLELPFNELGQKRVSRQIEWVFDEFKPSMVYYEGKASINDRFSHKRLCATIAYAKANNVQFYYFLPDAHEMWDEFCASVGSASRVHYFRYRKRKLLNVLASYPRVTACVPSLEFWQALTAKLNDGLAARLASISVVEIPPGANPAMFSISKSVGDSISSKVVNEQEASVRFIYAGGIGVFYSLHRLLIALTTIRTSKHRFDFYLRKQDLAAIPENYKRLITDASIEVISGSVPNQIEGDLAVGLLLLEPTEYLSVASPLKFYSYIERGWPIVAFQGTVAGRTVKENDLGWVLEPKVDSIVDFFTNEDLVSEYSKKVSNILTYREANTWQHRIQKLARGN